MLLPTKYDINTNKKTETVYKNHCVPSKLIILEREGKTLKERVYDKVRRFYYCHRREDFRSLVELQTSTSPPTANVLLTPSTN